MEIHVRMTMLLRAQSGQAKVHLRVPVLVKEKNLPFIAPIVQFALKLFERGSFLTANQYQQTTSLRTKRIMHSEASAVATPAG